MRRRLTWCLVALVVAGLCVLFGAVVAAGAQRTTANIGPGRAQQVPILASRTTLRYQYTWRESRLVAPFWLTIRGVLNVDAVLQPRLSSRSRGLVPPGWGFYFGPPRMLKAGPFEMRFNVTKANTSGPITKVPSRPGSYEVIVAAMRSPFIPGEGFQRTSFGIMRIRPPIEGVVTSARMSRTRYGGPVGRVPRGTTRLWATFGFAPSGLPRTTPKATWYGPGGTSVGSAEKSQRYTVRSFAYAPQGLAPGVWTCRLEAGGRIAKSVSVRVG